MTTKTPTESQTKAIDALVGKWLLYRAARRHAGDLSAQFTADLHRATAAKGDPSVYAVWQAIRGAGEGIVEGTLRDRLKRYRMGL